MNLTTKASVDRAEARRAGVFEKRANGSGGSSGFSGSTFALAGARFGLCGTCAPAQPGQFAPAALSRACYRSMSGHVADVLESV
jgi:hypothetical protein